MTSGSWRTMWRSPAAKDSPIFGRTGIYELFKISDATRSLIVQKVPGGEIRRHAVGHGMVTLREDAWAKACAGQTTVAEILRVTQEDT